MSHRALHSTGRIAVAGGGTGGHIFPALAAVEVLRRRGWERILWIGSRSRADRAIVEERGIEYHGIPAGKLRRYFSVRNALDVFNVLGGFFASLRILIRRRPAVLFSKGGFVSVPPAAAAWLLRIPVVSHECDLSPGLATRINSFVSLRILVSYPETVPLLGRAASRAILTGNPVREAIKAGSRERGRSFLGVSDGLPVLLVVGGSLGASALNAAVRACRGELTRGFFVVHQCGKTQGAERGTNYVRAPFFSAEYPDIMAAADLVVCRAGANGLSELAMLGKPAVLIPLPRSSSRGDQIENARRYAGTGAAVVLDQSGLDGAALRALVEGLAAEPGRLEEMGRAAASLAHPGAAESIAGVLIAVARGRRGRLAAAGQSA